MIEYILVATVFVNGTIYSGTQITSDCFAAIGNIKAQVAERYGSAAEVSFVCTLAQAV